VTEHLTLILRDDTRVTLQAVCEEHGPLDSPRCQTVHGRNVAVLEARAHDDMAHGVYRSEADYLAALREHRASVRA